MTYTDNSSICKAAIHSEVIKDTEGGIFEIELEPGKKSFIGSSKNNIESNNYPYECNRSFRVKKYKPNCPINKLTYYFQDRNHTSFLGIEEKLDFYDKNQITNINNFKKITENNELMKKIYSFLQFKKKIKSNKNLNNFIKTRKSDQNNKINSIKNDVNNSNKSLKDDKSTPNITEHEKKQNLEEISFPYIEQNTQESIMSLHEIKKKDFKILERYRNDADEFKIMLGKISFETNNLISHKELGLKNHKIVYKSIKKKIIYVMKKLLEIERKSQQRESLTEHKLNKSSQKIKKFLSSDQFIEDYSNLNINENYSVYNSLVGVGIPSQWDYFMYGLDGHGQTISQKGAFQDSKSVK